MDAIDETGNVYGRLVVIRRAKGPRWNGKQRGAWWLCLCNCGKYKTVHGKHLRDGGTKSCGCLKEEEISRFKEMIAKEPSSAAAHSYYSNYRSKARRRKIQFDISEEEFIEITTTKCHYCGSSPEHKYNPSEKYNGGYIANGIDRKDSMLGYTKDNIVPCCSACNFAKGTMTYEEFMQLVKRIYLYWIAD